MSFLNIGPKLGLRSIYRRVLSGGLRAMLPAVVLHVAVLHGGCTNTPDVGLDCEGSQVVLASATVTDENPTTEYIALTRDRTCDSVLCLRQFGLQPFCTRQCGQDNDCPDGFACQVLFPENALTHIRYCVHKTCSQSFDCGDLDLMTCERHVQYDSCAGQTQTDCPEGQLVTKPLSGVNCNCPSTAEQSQCTDAELSCTGDDGAAWPANTVTQIDLCRRSAAL